MSRTLFCYHYTAENLLSPEPSPATDPFLAGAGRNPCTFLYLSKDFYFVEQNPLLIWKH